MTKRKRLRDSRASSATPCDITCFGVVKLAPTDPMMDFADSILRLKMTEDEGLGMTVKKRVCNDNESKVF